MNNVKGLETIMHKHIMSLILLTVSFYVLSAVDELQHIPSLRDLALQRVVQAMTSKEEAQRFACDPEHFEEYVESHGINNGAIKELIVDQLLESYKHDNEMYKYKKLEVGSTVYSVAWHPEGNLIASGCDKEMCIWDIPKRELERVKRRYTSIDSVAWHPSDDLVALGGEQIHIWDRSTGKIVKQLGHGRDLIWSVAWHPEGNIVASGSLRGLYIWDACTGEIVKQLPHENWVMGLSVVWHPEGNIVASGSIDGIVRIWDRNTGEELRQLRNQDQGSSWVKSVAWHPKGNILASGSFDSTIRIWDWQTGQELKQLVGHQGAVYSVAWHPGGKMLASGSSDKTIRLWDTDTGQELKQLVGHQDDVRSVSWHPDGELLASGSCDKTIRLWHTEVLKVYDRLIDSVSLMQALYFAHCMEYADIMNPVVDKGKEEEKRSMDDQDIMSKSVRWFFGLDHIEQNLHALKGIRKTPQAYMKDVENSLPDALKRMLHQNHKQ